MAFFEDAHELVRHAKNEFAKLEGVYNASLTEQAIKPTLLIEIKNIMENLRSALDYSAHGLFAKYGAAKGNPKIYFPYASLKQDKAAFTASNRIEICIPGITASRPDIVKQIEGYQYFSSPENKWLPQFMDLNNENKHAKLTPQTRQEQKQLRLESRGAAIHLGHGASINLGHGASIRMGDMVISGAQNFSGDQPAMIQGSGTQTVIIWVSFIFDYNGEQVVPFLKAVISGVENIIGELAVI